MGIGGNSAGSGVFTPSKGTVFINGTAPFVYSGQILSSAPEFKIITPTVFYNSLNPPPANKITGLLDYIWDEAPQKYAHPNFSNQTRHFKLGRLVLPQNGRQAQESHY